MLAKGAEMNSETLRLRRGKYPPFTMDFGFLALGHLCRREGSDGGIAGLGDVVILDASELLVNLSEVVGKKGNSASCSSSALGKRSGSFSLDWKALSIAGVLRGKQLSIPLFKDGLESNNFAGSTPSLNDWARVHFYHGSFPPLVVRGR